MLRKGKHMFRIIILYLLLTIILSLPTFGKNITISDFTNVYGGKTHIHTYEPGDKEYNQFVKGKLHFDNKGNLRRKDGIYNELKRQKTGVISIIEYRNRANRVTKYEYNLDENNLIANKIKKKTVFFDPTGKQVKQEELYASFYTDIFGIYKKITSSDENNLLTETLLYKGQQRDLKQIDRVTVIYDPSTKRKQKEVYYPTEELTKHLHLKNVSVYFYNNRAYKTESNYDTRSTDDYFPGKKVETTWSQNLSKNQLGITCNIKINNKDIKPFVVKGLLTKFCIFKSNITKTITHLNNKAQITKVENFYIDPKLKYDQKITLLENKLPIKYIYLKKGKLIKEKQHNYSGKNTF